MASPRPPVLQDGPDVLLDVRVQPRASRSELLARPPGALTLRLTAPPVEGASNMAACRFLADLLDLPRSRVVVERGDTSRHKRIRIRDATASDVAARLLAAAR